SQVNEHPEDATLENQAEDDAEAQKHLRLGKLQLSNFAQASHKQYGGYEHEENLDSVACYAL
ncbi:MAG: hypothetical protein AB1813_10045, partial [Verrucomicrobiota bacterium]